MELEMVFRKNRKIMDFLVYVFFLFLFTPQIEILGSWYWGGFCVCDHVAAIQVFSFRIQLIVLLREGLGKKSSWMGW